MSWGEILKALNKDPNKSLDTLIKEQFNNNFGASGDVYYIKNTQLGTNLNNLLQGSSSSTIDFNNKPLVDKINYLLLNTGTVEYVSSNSSILTSYLSEKRTSGGIGNHQRYTDILSYTFLNNGVVKISVDIKKDWDSNDDSVAYDHGGISISKNSEVEKNFIIKISGHGSSTYTNKTALLNVRKGDNIKFYLQSNTFGGYYCKNFKVLGELQFLNPNKK